MYTIKQASLRSGVGVSLLRAWERRYGVVQPVRTPSGYRLYDDAAIERLRAMRQLVEAGWSPREAAPRVISATAEQLAELQRGEPAFPADARVPASEAERLAEEIVRAAARMDQQALEAGLDAAFSSARYEVVVERIIFPALGEIGEAWSRGELDVAAEHAASAAVLRRLGAAYQAAGNPADGPAVLVGLPPGARHELAALAFATTFRRAGLRVVYLGADVPLDSWLAAVENTAADVAVLGAVMPQDADAAAAVLGALAGSAPSVARAVGGRYADAVAGGGHIVLPNRLDDAAARLRDALPPRHGQRNG